MKNGNGKWVVRFLVGALWLIVFTFMTTLTKNVISNDKESRNRDYRLEEKLYLAQKENGEKLGKIKDNMSEQMAVQRQILTELKYLRNGRPD